ncbi:MAG: hypothetical protein ACI4KD_00615 [Oscillospiraceae bacterium]
MNEKIKLLIKDCAKYNNEYYFIAEKFNLVFSLNVDDGKITLIDCDEDLSAVAKNTFGAIAIKDDKMYITHNRKCSVLVYDFLDKTHNELKLNSYALKNADANAIMSIAEYKDELIFIGCHYPALIRYNTINQNIRYIEKPYSVVDDKDIAYFRTHHVIISDALYLASLFNNSVLKYNLEEDCFEWIDVGNKNNRYSGIAYDGTNFWLSPRTSSPIVRWNGNTDIEEFELPAMLKGNSNYFFGVFYDNDSMIFPNAVKLPTIIIDKKTNNISFINKVIKFQKTIGTDIIIQNSDSELTVKSGDLHKKFNLEIDYNEIKDFYKSKKMKFDLPDLMFEGDYIDVEAYMDLIQNGVSDKIISSDIGRNIHEIIKASD